MNEDVFKFINKQRIQEGLLTIEEIINMTSQGNKVFDVFSTLISKNVKIGKTMYFILT